MLTEEEHALITRVGPGTPGGQLLRRYWQPAALSEEVPQGGAPLPVRLLGEDLVLFRDEQGRLGLLGLHCSHRGADLSYGRLEDGGLRCIYHGWLYDIHGRCLEQPGEPAFRWTDSGGGDSVASSGLGPQPQASTFHKRIRHPAYPCQEVAGVIFAYLGPGELPLLPAYDLFLAPEDHRYVPTKSLHECNYLQGNEGNYDPLHLYILHRLAPTKADEAGNGRWDLSEARGTIDVEETDYGLRVYTVRPGIPPAGPEEVNLKVTNFVMPNLCAIKGGPGSDGYQIDWHVPIDDVRHWKYTMAFSRTAPVDRSQRLRGDAVATGYRRVRNAGNRYLQDREEMRSRTFGGMGTNNLDLDACVIESMGPVQDWTEEHLGYTDRAIVMARLMLLKAIRDVQEGRDPLHVVRDPAHNDFPHLFAVGSEILSSSADWRTYWREAALAGPSV